MQSLARLRAKINDLLAKRAAIAAQPRVDVYLPDNGRGPNGPLSDVQIAQATPTARIIIFPPGSPPPEFSAWQARKTVRP
jgi:hypothetical protein